MSKKEKAGLKLVEIDTPQGKRLVTADKTPQYAAVVAEQEEDE